MTRRKKAPATPAKRSTLQALILAKGRAHGKTGKAQRRKLRMQLREPEN